MTIGGWPGQRLIEVVQVEVVQVEVELPLRRGEYDEIRQVRVSAQLGVQARPRSVPQVFGQDLGRTAVEGERGNQHPAMPDRHQIMRVKFCASRRATLDAEVLDLGSSYERLPFCCGTAEEC